MKEPVAPPPAPDLASLVFGANLARAEEFVAILADTGVTHGLIGPREVPRLWERHVLNCAVVAEAMPTPGATVIDVGSGAGLPGLALAIARPDLRVTLVEPMLRRTNWLSATISALGLDNAEVCRGRAEEFHGRLQARYVTARAVAALDTLLGWCAPLTEVGGELVLMKGESAAAELAAAGPALSRTGMQHARLLEVGLALPTPTVVVLADKTSQPRPSRTLRPPRAARRR